MKHTFLICLMSISVFVNAQEKQSVYSIVEERHEKEWYKTQHDLWKEDALNGAKSANAWYNFYTSTRALRIFSEEDELPKYASQCQSISDTLLQLFPESFEANYIAFWQSGWANEGKKYLWKAVEINPTDERLYDDLLIEYELSQNETKRAEMAKKMVSKNYLSLDVMTIGHNILSELDPNAIVFTAGDNDTYSLWLNQFGMGYREDVTVLNTFLIGEPEYREAMSKKLGLDLPDSESMGRVETVEYIMQNSKFPVYIPASVYDHVKEELNTENLYLTGLNYRYSEESIDNLSLIRRNFEKRYALDHLKYHFTYHRMDANGKHFNYFYILPFVKLYQMYRDSEELEKQEEVKLLLERIIDGSEMEDQVNELIHCKDC